MIRLLLAVSIAISDYLRRYMPTNKIRDRVYTREGLKWGIPAVLLAVPYFGIALWLSRIIETGAPGWLNVAVLICLWCGFKMLWLGPSVSSCSYEHASVSGPSVIAVASVRWRSTH